MATDAVIQLVLQKLADSLIQEYGVGDQVKLLAEKLTRMLCFLKDADAKQEVDERVKNWVRDVRDVAYDAEDIIDTFLFKVAPSRRGGFMFCNRRYAFFFNELIARHKVGLEIRRIENKIRAISEVRLIYGIENVGQGTGTSSAETYGIKNIGQGTGTRSAVEEPDFVGLEKDLEMLVARLTEGELRRCVISVVGMGGLGKTTLTSKLYNTTRVKKHFDSCGWISVSQGYDVRDLLQDVIKRCMVLSKNELEPVEKMTDGELRENISKFLNDKRYLVVLDDIWTGQAWDALKDALPDKKNGSRVLLTTRNKDVALHADARSQPHELRSLNSKESWELFCKKTFPGPDGCCPPDLQELGREIVGNCHGLPLAIKVIGGLLCRKEPGEWENISRTIIGLQVETRISEILSFSYRDLPYYLKPCFLYMGIFPEDYEICTRTLIRLWAAEGFLLQRGDEELEETGEFFLNELIQRSMVQVASSSSRGVKSCRIHDMLRDLSILKAKEGGFLEVHCWNVNAPASRARRLAIHHNTLSNYNSLTSSSPRIRTVLVHTQGNVWLQREQEKFLYRGLKLLRVLNLQGVSIEKIPREIGELIHLRYLEFTQTYLKTLPSSIGNLCNLQTLCVKSYHNIQVPSTIRKMRQLRHLVLKGIDEVDYLGWLGSWGVIEGHPSLDRMSNLQTLSGVKAGKWMEGFLGNHKNLRKLEIGLDIRADDQLLYEFIGRLDCLQSLSVVTLAGVYRTQGLLVLPLSHLFKLSKLHLEGKLGELPEPHKFPTNLIKLTLAYSCLNHDPLATLEKLCNLRVLRLLGYSYKGNKMACSAQGFPQLESLHLQGLHQLEEWSVEEGALPALSHLQINTCLNLKRLPEGLQYVTTLKKLDLQYMPTEFKERLQEDVGEDWHKICHIPSINIGSYYDEQW